MARLYANENFPLRVVLGLRGLGHDVLTVAEAGKAGRAISDEDVLTFAILQGRAVLTLNRQDFIRLHRDRPDHTGIIVCTQDDDTSGQAHRIHEAILREQPLNGKLVRVYRPMA
jgi:hypothetical protein